MDLPINLWVPKKSGNLLSNRVYSALQEVFCARGLVNSVISASLDPNVLLNASSPITDMLTLKTVRYRTAVP
jgi:hypothetical protein